MQVFFMTSSNGAGSCMHLAYLVDSLNNLELSGPIVGFALRAWEVLSAF
jgi:hypothetical protein